MGEPSHAGSRESDGISVWYSYTPKLDARNLNTFYVWLNLANMHDTATVELQLS